MKRSTAAITIALGLLVMLTPRAGLAQTGPTTEFLNLDQMNAAEGTALPPSLFNVNGSRLSLLGGIYTGGYATNSAVFDATRGVAYLPEPPAVLWGESPGGDIAVIDLKTLAVQRRLFVQYDGAPVTPTGIVGDPPGNRLFVSDLVARRVYVVDVVTGSAQIVDDEQVHMYALAYSRTTNRLFMEDADRRQLLIVDMNAPDAPPVEMDQAPDNTAIESLQLVNEASGLFYEATYRQGWNTTVGRVYAWDINPASATYGQIVWTTTGTVAAVDFGGPFLQPALDRVRQRLYVPDVVAGVIRVFDAAPGPSLHQELTPIDISTALPRDLVTEMDIETGGEAYIVPTVDEVTGMIYAVLESCSWNDPSNYCAGTLNGSVVAIDPEAGVVGAAPLPRAWGRADFTFNIQIDPGSRRLLVWDFTSRTTVLEDLRTTSLETAVSTGSVTVAAPEASVTFAAVDQAGTTTIAPIPFADLPEALPGVFSVGGALLYDVSTSASISGTINLCFTTADVEDPAVFASLRVLHYENGSWVDRTTTSDYASHRICASTSSLSPFAIARLTSPAYTAELLYSTDRAHQAGSTVPLKVQIRDWAAANVSSGAIPLKAVLLRRPSDGAEFTVQDSGSANGDGAFRYDPELQGYVYNLSTNGLPAGTYVLTADFAGQGNYVQLPFRLR